ncbi:MAG: hypothetical protein ACI93R_002875 [Flavobacteriales bacterium]|jgi:uncharacterized protein YjfI (DUF2170 family)
MNEILDALSLKLNQYGQTNAVTFDSVISEDNCTLEVICSTNPDFPIYVSATENQILSVSPLFTTDTVVDGKIDELNKVMLGLSPVVPLSSLGTQGEMYILYGAMAVNTVFENIVHELEVQAMNTLDVIDALKEFLK